MCMHARVQVDVCAFACVRLRAYVYTSISHALCQHLDDSSSL